MFVTIRIYETPQPKQEIARYVEEHFIPAVKENPEFRGWYIVDAGQEKLASITLFERLETALRGDRITP